MTVKFTPLDHEFAAASGSNVNFDSEWSYFDHPPNSTKDLTVTSNVGDPDPYTFEVGESYDITWSGHGGGVMEDAVVIRSDVLSGDSSVIVFEGVNSNTGELFQMVWTPNFDLEDWYWSNGGGPSSPNAFWTGDQDTSVASICFAEGTLIDTPRGTLLIESLKAGDLVTKLDHGPRAIRWISGRRQGLRNLRLDQMPVFIREGALGEGRPFHPLILSPQHRVLVGGDTQMDGLGIPEALIAAKSLVMLPGVRHMRGRSDIRWWHFALGSHEIIRANGCLSESLLVADLALKSIGKGARHELAAAYGQRGFATAGLDGRPSRPLLKPGKFRPVLRHYRHRSKLDLPQVSQALMQDFSERAMASETRTMTLAAIE